MVSAILTFIAYSVIYYIPTPMLKEYLCDNHSQWNNSLVAMETQSPVNDKEKRTMYPRQPPRVLQTSYVKENLGYRICILATKCHSVSLKYFLHTVSCSMKNICTSMS
jgi:hypothetical protein